MPFNQGVKRGIVFDKKAERFYPCVFCGRDHLRPDAVHIVDEKEWIKKHGQDSKVNGMPLCPNCHRSFDEIIRPKLYKALKLFGCEGLPTSWEKSNKYNVKPEELNLKKQT